MIVEEIVIQGDSAGAEKAWARVGEASKSAATKMSASSRRAQEEMRSMARIADGVSSGFSRVAIKVGLISAAWRTVRSVAIHAIDGAEQYEKTINGGKSSIEDMKNSWVLVGQAIGVAAIKTETLTQAFDFMATGMRGLAHEISTNGFFSGMKSLLDPSKSLADEQMSREAENKALTAGMPLVPLVPPPKTGRGGGKEERPMIEFGDIGGTAALALEEAEKNRAELLVQMEQDIADQMAEIGQANFDRRVETENALIEMQEEAAEERERIAKEEARATQQVYDIMGQQVSKVFGSMALTAVDALFAMAEGQSVNLAAIADEFLKQTGRQLVASGVQHALQAAAMGLTGNPGAAGLAAVAAAEIVVGGGMMSGSLAIPNEAGGGARGGGGGGSGDFAAAAGRSRRTEDSSPKFKDETIVINVNGVLTSKEAGRELIEAIDQARRKYS